MSKFSVNEEAHAGDIIFECPHCGKSLAIDPRGEGAIITCPDCRQNVQVPAPARIPAVPAIDLPDSVEECHEVIRTLSESLAASQEKVQRLVETLEEIRERRFRLEQVRTDNLARFERISGELTVLQSALDRLVEITQDARSEIVTGE